MAFLRTFALIGLALMMLEGCGGCDEQGSGTVTLNQPPTADAGGAQVVQPGARVQLDGSMSLDPEGAPLTFEWTQVKGTSVTLEEAQGEAPSFTAPAEEGALIFELVVGDGAQSSEPARVTVTVTGGNTPPEASAQTLETPEDTALDIILTGVDEDGDPLSFSIVDQPTQGVLTGEPPTLVYTPNTDFNGEDTLSFTASDGASVSEAATVTITVVPVNDPPVANDQEVETDEDTPVDFELEAEDLDGDALAWSVTTQGELGQVEGEGPVFTYTPGENLNGEDVVVVSVSDGTESVEATVTITVAPINDAPVARSQMVAVTEGEQVGFAPDVEDVDGDPLRLEVVEAAERGEVVGELPELEYVPGEDFEGVDRLVYRVSDGVLDSEEATVTFTVEGINDPPQAEAQSVETQEDTPLSITLSGSDVETPEDELVYTITQAPSQGALEGQGQDLVYTPETNFHGEDTFAFTVGDGDLTSEPATVTITVTPINDPPTAEALSLEVEEDSSLAIELIGSDVDGDDLSFVIVAQSENGVVGCEGASCTYQPAEHFHGSDSFTYQVNDGQLDSDVVEVSIEVTPVNDPPVADDQSVETSEDTPVEIVLAVTDIDGDDLDFEVQPPTQGVLEGEPPNLTYRPAQDFSGEDAFTWTVSDGVEGVEATVTISVSPVNDRPVVEAGDDQILGPGNIGALAGSATDVEGDALAPRWSVTDGPGLVVFEHAEAFETRYRVFAAGTYTFTLSVSDGELVGADEIVIDAQVVNTAPSVDVQTQVAKEADTPIGLIAVVDDDGLPNGELPTSTWRVISGPGEVVFEDEAQPDTQATFSEIGVYTLELSATDGALTTTRLVQARVGVECTSASPSGLVAWFTGNGHPRDLIGGVSLTAENDADYASATVEQGFSFDGEGGHFIAQASPSLDVGQSEGITVEMWMNPDVVTFHGLVSWEGGLSLYTLGSGQIRLLGLGVQHDSPGILIQGAEQHIAWTYDRTSGTSRIFHDGDLVSEAQVGDIEPDTSGDLWLGHLPDDIRFMMGTLDEVSIYDRALSLTEVRQIVDAGRVGKCAGDDNLAPSVDAGPDVSVRDLSRSARLEGVVSDDGLPLGGELISSWSRIAGQGEVTFADNAPTTEVSFSESGIYTLGLTARDCAIATTDTVEVRVGLRCTAPQPEGLRAWYAGNSTAEDKVGGAPAELRNGATYGEGTVAHGFALDGQDDHVVLGATEALDVGQGSGVSVEFHHRPDGGAFGGLVLWQGGVSLYRTNSQLRVNAIDTDDINHIHDSPGGLFVNGESHHYAWTYDALSGTSRIYKDGDLVGESNLGSLPMKTDGDVFIGHLPGDSHHIQGTIDEVSLYDRALSPAEVRAIVEAGSSGKCPADGNSAPVVDAGPVIVVPEAGGTIRLGGVVQDDGLPSGEEVTASWRQISGPGQAQIVAPSDPGSPATFDTEGLYVLELSADDGSLIGRDTVEARVGLRCTGPTPEGLALWWTGNQTFTDAVGGTVLDPFNGVQTGPGFVADGFIFDGQDDHLVAAASEATDVGNEVGITVELWAESNQFRFVNVVRWLDGTAFYRQGSQLRIDAIDTEGGLHQHTSPGGMFVEGERHHLAWTYNAQSGLSRIYRDGALVSEVDLGSFTPRTAGDLWIGKHPVENVSFEGLLDEVSIYRRPLTSAEIGDIVEAGSGGKCPADGNQPPTIDAGAPVYGAVGSPVDLSGTIEDDGLPAEARVSATWRVLHGPGEARFTDQSAAQTQVTFDVPGLYILALSADDGSLVGRGLTEARIDILCEAESPESLRAWWRANGAFESERGVSAAPVSGATFGDGAAAQGFSLDGQDDHLVVAASETLDVGLSDGMSVDLFVRPVANRFTGFLAWSGGVALYANGAQLRVFATDSEGGQHIHDSPSGFFQEGELRHVAWTYDKITGRSRIYRDGALVGEADLGIFTPKTDTDLFIGHLPGDIRYFEGIIDEIGIYDRTLSATEVLDLSLSAGQGRCPLDGNSPPSVDAGPDLGTDDLQRARFSLAGLAEDDGTPLPLTTAWAARRGDARFDDPSRATTLAEFDREGLNVLSLSASDGAYLSRDLAEVRVGALCEGELAETLDNAMVAWWTGNEHAEDLIGGHDLDYVSARTHKRAVVSSGFELDGDDDRLETAASEALDIGAGDGLTVELWAIPGNNSLGGYLTWRGGVSLYHQGSVFRIYADDTEGNRHIHDSPGGTLQNAIPVHLAWTYDKLTGTSRIYVDGSLASEADLGIFTPKTDTDLTFGHYPGDIYYADGILDEVTLYDRVLSDAEIAAVTALGVTGKCHTRGNLAPVVEAGDDLSGEALQPLALAGVATDDGAPNDLLNTRWSLIEGPGLLTFDDPRRPDATATASQPGTYVIRLRADDGLLYTDDTLTLSIAPAGPNAPPFVEAGPDLLAAAGVEVALAGEVVDEGQIEATTINWTQISGPAQAIFTDANTPTSGVTFPVAGTWRLRLEATDGQYTVSDEVHATVRDNSPPSVEAGDAVTAYVAGRQPGDDPINNGRFIPPFLWAANHDDQSVTRFNTERGVEEGIYWVGSNPSRTAVDLDGNMWVGGRNDGRLTKVYWNLDDCEDRNQNGLIDTSFIEDGEAVMVNSPEDPLADECVAWSDIPNNGEPSIRGVAAGPEGRIWIGYTNGGVQSIDPRTFEVGEHHDSDCVPLFLPDESGVQQPVEDACEDAGGIYGLVVDSTGHLWATSFARRDTLMRFDTTGERWEALYTGRGCGSYGIALDSRDRIWLGSSPTCSGVGMFDPATRRNHHFALPDDLIMTPGARVDAVLLDHDESSGAFSHQTTGVAVQPGTDDVWVSFYLQGYTGRLRVDDQALADSQWTLIATTRDANNNQLPGVGVDLRGIGFDAQGNAWTLGLGSDRLFKIDPNTDARDESLPVGLSIGVGTHYTYSDFTGSTALAFTVPRQVAHRAALRGQVSDDGLPTNTLTSLWRVSSGPGPLSFDTPENPTTAATFVTPGLYTLALEASDGALSAQDTVSVTVVENRPPLIVAGPDITTSAGAPVLLEGSVTDPDNVPPAAPLSASWHVVSGPEGQVIFSDTAAVTSATFFVPGTYTVRLRANDTMNRAFADATVTVTEPNRAPLVEAGPTQRVVLPANRVTLDGEVDDDGLPDDVVSVSWGVSEGPGRASFDDPSALDTSVTFDTAGTWILRLSATDGERTAYDEVAVLVDSPDNRTPSVDAGPDRSVDLGASVHLVGRIDDDGAPEAPEITTLWSVVAGPQEGVVFGDDSARVTFATFDAPGVYTLRLSATDGVLESHDDLIITAAEAFNRPPVVNAGADRSLVLPDNTPQLLATATDDGQPPLANITWRWIQSEGPAEAVFDDRTLPDPTLTLPVPGLYRFQAFASDGQLSGFDEITLTLGEGDNSPPIARAGADLETITGVEIEMVGTITDDGNPEQIPLLGSWRFEAGPEAPTVLDERTELPTVTQSVRFRLPGVYHFQLHADDGQLVDGDNLRVTVTPGENSPPIVSAGDDQSIFIEDNEAQLTGSAQDDGLLAPLAVWWTKASGPGSVTFTSPFALETQASFGSVGTYLLRLHASDAAHESVDEVQVVVEAIVNAPPVVDAGLDTLASLARPASLRGSFEDDAFPREAERSASWSALTGPGEVRFADPEALVTEVTFTATGLYRLRLEVSDTESVGFDDIEIEVLSNLPPGVDAGQARAVLVQQAYLLVGTLDDDGIPGDGLAGSWSQVAGPAQVEIAQEEAELPQVAARISFPVLGSYRFRLTATDGALSASDEVVLHVRADNAPPTVSLSQGASTPTGEALSFVYDVADDGLPTGTLTERWTAQGPGSVEIVGSGGQVEMTFDTAGIHTLSLEVCDGALCASDSADVIVRPGADVPPLVQIADPLDGDTVSAPISVLGTADALDLDNYRLEMRTVGETAWTLLEEGNAPVVDGVLGRLDPTLLLNGAWELRLRATDAQARTSISESVFINIEGALKVGQVSYTFTDMALQIGGLPLSVRRTYDSRDKTPGDFGVGWRLDVTNVRIQKNRHLGREWQQYQVGRPPFLFYGLDANVERTVTLTFPGGEVFRFRAVATPASQIAFPIQTASVSFEPVPGTVGELRAVGDNDVLVAGGIPGATDLVLIDGGRDYNPTRFEYTSPGGDVFLLDEVEGLLQLTDRFDNRLTFDQGSITSSRGAALTIERDNENRIVRIVDPKGEELTYEYRSPDDEDTGDLWAVVDRSGGRTEFDYHDQPAHHLKDIIDPRGIRAVRNEYDEEGRLVRRIDPEGNAIEFDNDLEGRVQVVEDRLDNPTIFAYDDRGNVLSVTDAIGETTRFGYDSFDNEVLRVDPLDHTFSATRDIFGRTTAQTDPLGRVSSTTFGAFNITTSRTNPKGLTTEYALGNRGSIEEWRTPGGDATAFTYAPGGDIATTTDALGNTTTWTRDPAGRVLRSVVRDLDEIVLRDQSFTYDDNGNRASATTRRTDPNDLVVEDTLTFVYDASDRLTETHHPDGTSEVVEYDEVGQVISRTDRAEQTTTYERDEHGRITLLSLPDGTEERATYDAEGRRLTWTDRKGRTHTYRYDALGRQTHTILPGGAMTVVEYDVLGRTVSRTGPGGDTVSWVYEEGCGCDRIARETRPDGTVLDHTYDQNGNRTTTAVDGHTTTYVYDDDDRLVRIEHPEGEVEHFDLDAQGWRASHTDGEDRVTGYAYNGLGQVIRVTDHLGAETGNTYDEAQNLVAITDAEGRTTRQIYDADHNLIERRLPGGFTEHYAYDPRGKVTEYIDAEGMRTTYSYDALGRVLSRTPDPRLDEVPTTFTYDASGLRATMEDALGTTTYTYDDRDRLIQKTTPIGTLEYTYDEGGFPLSVRTPDGQVHVSYTYGEGHRLASITDEVSDHTVQYTQGPFGPSTIARPGGVTTTLTRDGRGRLGAIAHALGGETLAGIAYERDLSGLKIGSTDSAGRETLWQFDGAKRLEAETIQAAQGQPSGAALYNYDAAGNRLGRQSDIAGLPTQSSSVDVADRLDAHAYDTRGNTTDDGERLLTYDGASRLIQAEAVSLAYDGDGHLAQKSIDGVTTGYLIDTHNPTGLPQILAEITNDQVTMAYAWGEGLAMIRSGEGQRFVLGDGLGSTRALVDDQGQVTDRYDYDAFGVMLRHEGTSANPYLFAGERWDADVALYYLRKRFLDPQTGRFLSRDPMAPDLREPLSINRYLYAHADPVNNTDPTGLFSITEVSTTLTIGADIRGQYNKELINAALDIAIVLECDVAPAAQMRNSALQSMAEGAGPWAYEAFAGATELAAERLQKVRERGAKAYENWANSLVTIKRSFKNQDDHTFFELSFNPFSGESEGNFTPNKGGDSLTSSTSNGLGYKPPPIVQKAKQRLTQFEHVLDLYAAVVLEAKGGPSAGCATLQLLKTASEEFSVGDKIADGTGFGF